MIISIIGFLTNFLMPVLWYYAHCSCVPYSAFLKSTLLLKKKKIDTKKSEERMRKIHCWSYYYFILKLQYTLFLFIVPFSID